MIKSIFSDLAVLAKMLAILSFAGHLGLVYSLWTNTTYLSLSRGWDTLGDYIPESLILVAYTIVALLAFLSLFFDGPVLHWSFNLASVLTLMWALGQFFGQAWWPPNPAGIWLLMIAGFKFIIARVVLLIVPLKSLKRETADTIADPAFPISREAVQERADVSGGTSSVARQSMGS